MSPPPHKDPNRYSASLRLAVAPMLDWTDTHCRVFHRIVAPHARLYTEMVHANAVLKGNRERLLGFHPSESPLALQLGGSAPATLAAAAAVGQQWGYDEINLNVGCPSDRVQAGRFGACLMKEPLLVAECVAAMTATVSVPVTVKCRLGVDDDDDYEQFLYFIDNVASAGCRTFIVHVRNAWLKGLSPKENRDIPPLRPEWAYRLKRARPQLHIVINGGIVSVETARTHLPRCDGVMLGRSAYHDPFTLHRLDAALFNGPTDTRFDLLQRYRPYFEQKLAETHALPALIKPLFGLFHGCPGGRVFRRMLTEGMQLNRSDVTLFDATIAAMQRFETECNE